MRASNLLSDRRQVRLVPVLVVLSLLSLPLWAADEAAADKTAAGSDAQAISLAERCVEAMGGQEAWDGTRYLRFNFFGVRQHHWDRHGGRHRLEGKSREGDSYVVVQSLHRRAGEAWVNGVAQEGEEKQKWLKRARDAWVNDTYWLLMPYKLQDPGVTLSYAGEETIDGVVYDKLQLSFEEVGLTPGDRYWAYLNRETGLMDRWAYFLQDWEEGRQPTVWSWLGWQRYGTILLAPDRVNLEDGREAKLGDLAVFDHLPDSVFSSPDPVAAP